ncbi:MAG: ABC transporter permease [Phycisphaerales bacterium]
MIARSIEYRWDLVTALLAKELRARYKRTFLGYAWSLLNPLAMACVFFVLVSRVFEVKLDKYPLLLVAGLFPWQWVANSISTSTNIFVGNASLIRRTSFPRGLLVVSASMNDLIHYLASVPVIVALMAWYGLYPEVRWLWLFPLLIVTQGAVVMGIAFIVATCNVFVRDLERIMSIAISLWFYVTPIIYTNDMLSMQGQKLLLLNPVAGVMIGWRSLYMGGPVNLIALASSMVWGALLLPAGYALFKRLHWRFAELV